MFSQIKETCIYVQDLNKTKEFYNGVLGLPVISFREDRHVFFRAGSSVLLCFLPEVTRQEKKLPPHFGSGEIHFALEAIDKNAYEQAKKILLQAGIPIEHETSWKGGKKSFYFRDPDRNLVEIVEKGIWE